MGYFQTYYKNWQDSEPTKRKCPFCEEDFIPYYPAQRACNDGWDSDQTTCYVMYQMSDEEYCIVHGVDIDTFRKEVYGSDGK